MISRRIDRKDGGDNYRALAIYIADAATGKKPGEKTLDCWYTGGEADNYLEGMIEVEATQALNIRTKKPKTYHLMVSFRPEDESKLTPEIFRDIEHMLAEALGFSDHQRHCGIHGNTDNLHMHVAYNNIHPQSLNRRAPYFDYPKLHQACRAIEQKYDLAVDEGMEQDRTKKDGLVSAKIKSIEAQTGQESFFSYIMRHKTELIRAIEKAADWREVHEAFLKCGLNLKPSGNGLTIKDQFGKHYAKPSAIDRSLSKSRLESILGPFEEASIEELRNVKAEETYSARPLHLGSERGGLYAAFQEEMKRRQEALETIKNESAQRYGAIKDKWKQKRKDLERIPLLKPDRQRLLLEIKKREQAELVKMRNEMAEARNEVRAEIPYTSWGKCLRHKAALGDETALAILRSKKEVIQPEIQTYFTAPLMQYGSAEKWLEKKIEIMKAPGLSNRHRQSLLAVAKMRELLERETPPGQQTQKLTHIIDSKGTIIFKLADGSTIRDTGKEIHFSARSETAKILAGKYAKVKWGPMASITGCIIKRWADKWPEQLVANELSFER